jgi:DNA (cytosine-5)-methyltransferase 1
MRLAELCAGYGGLGMAMRLAGWPVELAWYAETDAAASSVMAAHHSGVLNVGDITGAQFTACEPVDIIAAGYPCQPFSAAGKRKGTEDERWIWPDIARAVRLARPRYVVLENVPGHLARGFPTVIADLAGLGYVGSWVCVRASDVGAPHRRERLFVLAADADRDPVRPEPVAVAGGSGAAVAGESGARARLSLLPTPTARDGMSGPGHAASAEGSPDLRTVAALLPTQRATDGSKGGPNQRDSSGDLMLPAAVQPDRWGIYAAAVARWGAITGTPAPDPTEPGRHGQPRLSSRFVEWMLGLPAGHVTNHVGRNPALRILGNGVVPQQGARALTLLAAQTPAARPTHMAGRAAGRNPRPGRVSPHPIRPGRATPTHH